LFVSSALIHTYFYTVAKRGMPHMDFPSHLEEMIPHSLGIEDSANLYCSRGNKPALFMVIYKSKKILINVGENSNYQMIFQSLLL
jgi:hypothetical protein